jgi:heat shock protein 5
MARSSRSSLALGLGLLCWIALLFSPLAMVQPAAAEESENYGTVIGIVSICRSMALTETIG